MHIGYFPKYKGCEGSIEYDAKDKICYGKLTNIEDLVTYEANDIGDLEKQYHEAVDEYIEFKKEIKEKRNDRSI